MQLTFRTQPTLPIESLPPPPYGTSRIFVQTDSGRLELLAALPPPDVKEKGPILFVHGGFGSADCYSNYLPYFAAQGYPSYSVSLRGHGHSWYPSYLRMVFLTTRHTFATDLVAALKYVSTQHDGKLCALVGHSAGGGLAQYAIANLVQVRALAMLASFPNFGGFLVYLNWFKLDPWFPLRILKDLYHPRSPLSSTNLTHRAFFSKEYPVEQVKIFESKMPNYESLLWPSQQTTPIARCGSVLNQIVSPSLRKSPKVLIMAGEQDALMGVVLMRWTAQQFASAAQTPLLLDSAKKDDDEPKQDVVNYYLLRKSGHNVMKDSYWEDGARRLLEFFDAID